MSGNIFSFTGWITHLGRECLCLQATKNDLVGHIALITICSVTSKVSVVRLEKGTCDTTRRHYRCCNHELGVSGAETTYVWGVCLIVCERSKIIEIMGIRAWFFSQLSFPTSLRYKGEEIVCRGERKQDLFTSTVPFVNSVLKEAF